MHVDQRFETIGRSAHGVARVTKGSPRSGRMPSCPDQEHAPNSARRQASLATSLTQGLWTFTWCVTHMPDDASREIKECLLKGMSC